MFWYIFLIIVSAPPTSTLFPYTTLFRSRLQDAHVGRGRALGQVLGDDDRAGRRDAARAERLERPRREVRRVRRVEEDRSEEHTSELQSLTNLVCRLLLEKKKKKMIIAND